MGLIPGLAQWVKDPELLQAMTYATGVVPIQSLTREHPHAADGALKRKKKKYIYIQRERSLWSGTMR